MIRRRQTKKSKSKKRKNPIAFDQKEYSYLLADTILKGKLGAFSHLIAYKNMGENCEACESSFFNCQCEGSREHKFDILGNVIQGRCEQCRKNYCVCDYPIWNEIYDDKTKQYYLIDDEDKIRSYAWELAKKDLSDDLLSEITDQIIEEGKRTSNFTSSLLNLLGETNDINKIRKWSWKMKKNPKHKRKLK